MDMLTIPEEQSNRSISTRRIGRISKRSTLNHGVESEINSQPKSIITPMG